MSPAAAAAEQALNELADLAAFVLDERRVIAVRTKTRRPVVVRESLVLVGDECQPN